MKGYVIFYVSEISDPDQLKLYQKAAHPTLAAAGGKVISGYGRTEVTEGDPLVGVVMIEFAGYDQAAAWYHSEGYKEAKALRSGAATCHAVIIEGRPD